jgi:hypothetical protein
MVLTSFLPSLHIKAGCYRCVTVSFATFFAFFCRKLLYTTYIMYDACDAYTLCIMLYLN